MNEFEAASIKIKNSNRYHQTSKLPVPCLTSSCNKQRPDIDYKRIVFTRPSVISMRYTLILLTPALFLLLASTQVLVHYKVENNSCSCSAGTLLQGPSFKHTYPRQWALSVDLIPLCSPRHVKHRWRKNKWLSRSH